MKNEITALFVCLISLSLITGVQNSFAETKKMLSDDYFGCTNQEYFKKVLGHLAEKDVNAFKADLSAGFKKGDCTSFKSGEDVDVTETASSLGLVKLRKKNETAEYWTVVEAVNE